MLIFFIKIRKELSNQERCIYVKNILRAYPPKYLNLYEYPHKIIIYIYILINFFYIFIHKDILIILILNHYFLMVLDNMSIYVKKKL